MIFDLLSSEFS